MKRARFNETLYGDLATVIFSMLKDDPVAIGCARLVCKDWRSFIAPVPFKPVLYICNAMHHRNVSLVRMLMSNDLITYDWHKFSDFVVRHDYVEMMRLLISICGTRYIDAILDKAIAQQSYGIIDLYYIAVVNNVDHYFMQVLFKCDARGVRWFIERFIDVRTYVPSNNFDVSGEPCIPNSVAVLQEYGMNDNFWARLQTSMLSSSSCWFVPLVLQLGFIMRSACDMLNGPFNYTFEEAWCTETHDKVRHLCGCESKKKKRKL